jgi:hypothetical protein
VPGQSVAGKRGVGSQCPEIVPDVGHALQNPVKPEFLQLRQGLEEVLVLVEEHDVRTERLRDWHQPQSEFGDDPEVRLGEDAVEVGTDPVRIQVGGPGAREVAESSAQHLA